MSFLMYAPKGRRDFLGTNLSIEEEFLDEAENIETLGNLYKTVESDSNRKSTHMGSTNSRTPSTSLLIPEVNTTRAGSSLDLEPP